MKANTEGLERNDQFILRELQKGNERAFDYLFNQYYTMLCRFAYSVVKDQEKAENLVQEVFIKIWEKRENAGCIEQLLPYLLRMVRNQSIDILRKDKADLKLVSSISPDELVNTTEEQVSINEFEAELIKSLVKLPEKCRVAFEMSRFDGRTNKQIAHDMQISVKGVEALIGRSLKILRVELRDFLPSVSYQKASGSRSVLFSLFINRLKLISILAFKESK